MILPIIILMMMPSKIKLLINKSIFLNPATFIWNICIEFIFFQILQNSDFFKYFIHTIYIHIQQCLELLFSIWFLKWYLLSLHLRLDRAILPSFYYVSNLPFPKRNTPKLWTLVELWFVNENTSVSASDNERYAR